jgi:large subunit ribosomal protein L21
MKYAIVESGGKQFRAAEGGIIEVDRLPVEAGSNVKLDQVLLISDGENVTIGTPYIKDNPVWTSVMGHVKGPKVNIFNYSPKKRIRVKTGHRQNYTRLYIEQVGGLELIKKAVSKEVDQKEDRISKIEQKEKAATKAVAATSTTKKPVSSKPAVKKQDKVVAKSAAKETAKKTSQKSAAKQPATKKPVAKKPAAKKPATKK